MFCASNVSGKIVEITCEYDSFAYHNILVPLTFPISSLFQFNYFKHTLSANRLTQLANLHACECVCVGKLKIHLVLNRLQKVLHALRHKICHGAC